MSHVGKRILASRAPLDGSKQVPLAFREPTNASPIYELPRFHLRLAIIRKQRVFALGRPLEVLAPRKYTAPENVAKFTRLSKLRNELITQASVALAPCSLSVAPSLSPRYCLSLSVSLCFPW